MRFLRRPRFEARSIAVFCGAFHPPTIAHLELARAARQRVDEVLWVMPESFPHKTYADVPLPQRLRLLLEASSDPIAIARENLFFSIAEEAAGHFPQAAIQLLIGEDGARRILDWDYGLAAQEHRHYLQTSLSRFPILSAQREADWCTPAEFESYIHWLAVHPQLASISSSLVRERIRNGEDWESLVPAAIRQRIRDFYGSGGNRKGQ